MEILQTKVSWQIFSHHHVNFLRSKEPPVDEKGESFKDTYHFKESIRDVEIQDSDLIGMLDIVGMFPNIPVSKMLEIWLAKSTNICNQ